MQDWFALHDGWDGPTVINPVTIPLMEFELDELEVDDVGGET